MVIVNIVVNSKLLVGVAIANVFENNVKSVSIANRQNLGNCLKEYNAQVYQYIQCSRLSLSQK